MNEAEDELPGTPVIWPDVQWGGASLASGPWERLCIKWRYDEDGNLIAICENVSLQ